MYSAARGTVHQQHLNEESDLESDIFKDIYYGYHIDIYMGVNVRCGLLAVLAARNVVPACI